MSEAQLQIRGADTAGGYELRRIRRAVEDSTLDRPPNELERGVLDHATEATNGVRLAQDHFEARRVLSRGASSPLEQKLVT